jgi:hypothetical protein
VNYLAHLYLAESDADSLLAVPTEELFMNTITLHKDIEHPPEARYETDFYAWAMRNAALLREGRLSEIDAENIAEELESMGKRERRELINRLAVLLAHLLKMNVQRDKLELHGNSWRATIREQRRKVADLLNDSPSLKATLPESFNRAYEDAIDEAVKETNLPESVFPVDCPFTLEQALTKDFWP